VDYSSRVSAAGILGYLGQCPPLALEKRLQFGQRRLRNLLGKVMPRQQWLAAHVAGNAFPIGHRVKVAMNHALLAP